MTPAESAGPASSGERVYVPGGALPDAAVLARLAGDFFAALPGALAVTDVTGAPEASGTLPVETGASPDWAGAFLTPGSALPADLLQSLRVPPVEPTTASVASPSGPSFYFLESMRSVPAEQIGEPGLAASMLPAAELAPAPGGDLPAAPNSPVGATGLPAQANSALPGASPVGSSFYFLQSETASAPNPVPNQLPVSKDFTFPEVAGFEPFLDAADLANAEPAAGEPPVPKAVAEPASNGHGGEPDLTRLESSEGAEKAGSARTVDAPIIPDNSVTKVSIPEIPTDSKTLGSWREAGAKAGEAGPSESSLYFVQAKAPEAIDAVPAKLPVTPDFALPGVPALQSVPGNAGVPTSEPSLEDFKSIISSLPGATPLLGQFPRAAHGLSLPYFVDPDRATSAPAAPLSSETFFQLSPGMLPELKVAPGIFDPRRIRQDFPILQERVHGRPLVWLDNGATTQKPNAVIDRISSYYRHENSNVHRAAHTLAARSTDAYEGAREKVRKFLNAGSTREIVFVRGTTEGINLVAKSWGWRNVEKDDEIVITWLEHHANIVPWQQLCEAKGAKLRVAPVDNTGQIKLDEYEKLLNPRTRIVAISHVSNALGTITPVRDMVRMAHRHGARVLIDGAQSVAHMREDMQELDCDFFVFSGHKVFAPFGVGVVYGKGDLFDNSPPWQGGGNMIVDVTFEKTTYNVAPARFEAGTGTIADAVGLGAALDYLTEAGIDNVTQYEHELLGYATEGLLTVPGLHLIGTAREKAGVLSFVIDGLRTEDIGKALDEEGIAVRAGHHCAQPILRRFGQETTVRATLAMYNICDDVDALVAALHRIVSTSGRRGVTR